MTRLLAMSEKILGARRVDVRFGTSIITVDVAGADQPRRTIHQGVTNYALASAAK
ncbi:hypothetical protein [Cryobacterium mannosilyticum]|uniref:hypothetical protein n=1 Tax=Cryobacterium mannosilyticum TaxID=1259190 RepID=UPI00141AC62C|nr:hypothetical protein [Cryobacterium mannosilyticum]